MLNYTMYYTAKSNKEVDCMKQKYVQPDVLMIKLNTGDVLTASDEEVFVDGDDLFG